MGGRGSSSGLSKNGKNYGTEFNELLTAGNVKFVRYNDAKSSKTPQETMTKGRVYVTVNKDDRLTAITYYDNRGKRTKSIDLTHPHNKMDLHVHHGYNHNENDGKKGAANLDQKEKRMVERVKKIWYNNLSK